jgi:hypothetical protein
MLDELSAIRDYEEIGYERCDERIRERIHTDTSTTRVNEIGNWLFSQNSCHSGTLREHNLQPLEAIAKTEGGGTITWGGPEGPTFSVNVNGSVQNDQGAYMRVDLEHNTKGEGKISVVGGGQMEIGKDRTHRDSSTSKEKSQR